MFIHVKEPQFEVKVTKVDPRFATLLQEQFGGGNGELKAAMQYFTQAIALRDKYPEQYDLLMDIATEELSHLEMVGMLITKMLDGLNDDLKTANETCDWLNQVTKNNRDTIIHEAVTSPLFSVLSGGGPGMVNSAGQYWTGAYINANGDPSVDLRSNIAAESRAKIVYEYLKQFTDDPGVQDTLTFLMTREVAHFQQFTAALNGLPENFPPGKLPGDERFTNLTFNMSNGGDIRGPWNQGQGPWPQGVAWEHVSDPVNEWMSSDRRLNKGTEIAPDGQPTVKGVTFFSHQEHVPAQGGGGDLKIDVLPNE